MTRIEYLNELKWQLKSLPVEEQEEALEYYRGFFEDACADDGDEQKSDNKIMAELGSPQELAQTIISKFASVPVTCQRRTENAHNNGSCGTFNNDEVRSLDIALGIAEIVMITGETFSVDYRGLAPGDIRYGLSPFGTFSIENTRKIPDLSFWNHNDTSGNDVNHPRILIRVPAQAKLDLLKLHIGAGSFTTKTVSLECVRSYIDVGAGNIMLSKITGGAANFRCGMGNLTFVGELHGLIKADCGMGNITLNLDGNPADYSISAKVGLGSVKFNEIHKNGLGTLDCTEQKQNHFSVNCGMGNVTIRMK